MLLEVRNIRKSFGRQTILSDISFDVDCGQTVAFIGENGAGKSTLAKCLVGVHEPDSGEIRINGTSVRLTSPAVARHYGIGLLPQELAYVPELTVAENIVLGDYAGRRGLTSPTRMRREAERSLKQLSVSIDLDARLSDLPLGERQLVEIAKALRGNMRLLLLDEPTAALNDDESRKLFDVLAGLTAAGVGALFVSHRMDEVSEFSDQVLVMRNGRLVARLDSKTATNHEMVTHMLGRPPELLAESSPVTSDGTSVLSVEDLSMPGPPAISRLNFSVGNGEVLGLFGVRGCGADLIASALAGQSQTAIGRLLINGEARPLFRSVKDSLDAGIGYVPPERKRDGIVPVLSVADNITLTVSRDLATLGVRSTTKEAQVARSMATDLDIRCDSLRQPIQELSGGNQQKALLASRILRQPTLMVLHEPTRGVDVGARLQIHQKLRELAAGGMSCLVVSSDAEEVVAVSDRILVLRDGRIEAELVGEQKTLPNAVHAAAHGA